MKVHFEKKTDFNLYFEMKRYVRIASEISYTFGFIMGPRGKGGFIYQGTRNVSFSQKKKKTSEGSFSHMKASLRFPSQTKRHWKFNSIGRDWGRFAPRAVGRAKFQYV